MSFKRAISASPDIENMHMSGVKGHPKAEGKSRDERLENLNAAKASAKFLGHDVHVARIRRDWAQEQWEVGKFVDANSALWFSVEALKQNITGAKPDRDIQDEYGASVMYVARLAGVKTLVEEPRNLEPALKELVIPKSDEASDILEGANNHYYGFSANVRSAIYRVYADTYEDYEIYIDRAKQHRRADRSAAWENKKQMAAFKALPYLSLFEALQGPARGRLIN